MTESYKRIEGYITARQGAVTGSPPTSVGVASTITYSAKGFIDLISGDRGEWVVSNHAPKRRCARGAKILVAEVGDPCTIVINESDTYLFVMEGVPFREACT